MATIEQIELAIREAERRGSQEAAQYLRQKLISAKRKKRIAELREKDPSTLESFGAGLGAGAVGTLESAALGGAAILEEEAEQEARKKIQAVAGAVRPEGGDPDSFAYGLGSAFGSIGALLPAAAFGTPGLAVAGGIGALAGAGEASERAREEGATEEERGTASLLGLGVGATEALPLAKLAKVINRLRGKVDDEVADDAIRRFNRLRNTGETAAAEGAQEIFAGIAQNMIESGYNPEQELFNAAVAEEGGYGAIAGGTLQGILELIGGRKGGSKFEKAEDVVGGEQVSESGFDDDTTAPPTVQTTALTTEELDAATDFLLDIEGVDPKSITDAQVRQTAQRLREQGKMPERTATQPERTATQIEGQLDLFGPSAEQQAALVEDTVDPGADLIESLARQDDEYTQSLQQQEQLSMAPDFDRDIERQRMEETTPEAQELARQTDIRNRGLLPGEQQDMFAAEQGIGRIAALRRQEQQRQQEEQARREMEEAQFYRDIAAEDDAAIMQGRQRELDFASRGQTGPQSVRGQQELFPEDPGVERAVGPTEAPQRPEPPTNEVPPQMDFDFERGNQSVYDDPGINRPRNQQNRIRKELAKGQKQREREQNLAARGSQQAQQAAAQRRATDAERRAAEQEAKREQRQAQREAQQPEPAAQPQTPPLTAQQTPIAQAVQGQPAPVSTVVEMPPVGGVPTATRAQANAAKFNEFQQAQRAKQAEQPKPQPEKAAAATPSPTPTQARDTSGRSVGKGGKPTAKSGQAETGTVGKRKPANRMTNDEIKAEMEAMGAPRAFNPRNRSANVKELGFLRRAQDNGTLEEYRKAFADKKPVAKKDEPPKDADNRPAQLRDAVERINKELKTATGKKRPQLQARKEQYEQELAAGKKTGQADKKPVTSSTKAESSVRKVVQTSKPKQDRRVFAYVETAPVNDVLADYARMFSSGGSNVDNMLEAIAHDLAVAPQSQKAAKAQKVNITRKDLEGLEAQIAQLDADIGKISTKRNAVAAMKKLRENGMEDLAAQVDKKVAKFWNGVAQNLGSKPVKEGTGVFAKADMDLLDSTRKPSEVLTIDPTTPEGREVQARIVAEIQAARADAIARAAKKVQNETAAERAFAEELEKAAKATKEEKAKLNKQIEAVEAIVRESFAANPDKSMLPMLESPELATAMPLHPGVKTALLQGDIRVALRALAATTNSKEVAALARRMAEFTEGMKVDVRKNLNIRGTKAAGAYDPESNTIYLDSENGLKSPLVMLHEMAHAITVDTLAKKSHPVTKQLTNLYNDVKDKLGTAYGAQDLNEFVAEALSNPKFQAELAQIRVDKSPESALGRFIQSLKRLFGGLMGRGGNTDANTEANRLIEKIIAPPKPDGSRGPSRYFLMATPAEASQIMNNFGKSAASINKGPHSRAYTASNRNLGTVFKDLAASKGGNKVLSATLQFFPLHDLAAVADSNGFGDVGYRISKAIETRSGRTQNREKVIKQQVLEVDALMNKLDGEQAAALNEVIFGREFGATIHQVDPTMSSSDALDKYGSDALKMEKYRQVKEAFNKLPPVAQQVFRKARDIYKRQYRDLIDIVENQVRQSSDAANLNKSQRESIYKKLNALRELDVYFPLTREGQYRVDYKFEENRVNREADVAVVELFDSEAEARAALKELKANPDVQTDSVTFRDTAYDDRDINRMKGAGGMISDVMRVLDVNGIDNETKAQVLNLFVDAMPETSLAKAFRGRKGTLGYIPDVMHGLRTKAFDIGRQVEMFRASREMNTLREEVNTLAEDMSSEGFVQPNVIANEMRKRIDFAVHGAANPKKEKWAQGLNQLAFVYTIGLNVASSLVNLTQVPMYVMPVLSGKYGYKETIKALLQAGKVVHGSKKGSDTKDWVAKGLNSASLAHGLDAYFDMDAQGNMVLRSDLGLSEKERTRLKELQPLVQAAYERGQLNRSILHEQMGIEEAGRNVREGWGKYWNMFTSLSAGMFNQAERFNRQTTMVAAYNLEYNRLKNDPKHKGKGELELREMAANQAIHETRQANGGNTLETAPRIAQEGLGRVAMMYRTYGVQMYINMIRMTKDLFGNIRPKTAEEKELRNVAFKQLMGLHGTVLFFSGAFGVPIYGALKTAVDLFLDEDEDDFDQMAENFFGEALYRGGLNQVLEAAGLDIDMGTRVRLTELLFQANKFNPDPSPEEQLFYYLGGPGWSTLAKMYRGGKEIVEGGDMQRGVETILPAAMGNVLKTFRYGDEGALTRRGDQIVGNLAPSELAAQLIGFAPERILRQQEENSRLKGLDMAISKNRTEIIGKLWLAKRMGDGSAYAEAMREMAQFNRKHRAYAISAEDISRSFKARDRESVEMYNGVSLSKNMRETLGYFGAMYDTPYTPGAL